MIGSREAAAAPATVRVVLADDDPGFLAALTAMVDTLDWLEVVGRAQNGTEAVDLFAALRPDVSVLDLAMPRCDGIEATRRIIALDAHACVVIMSATDNVRAFSAALALGARGCVRKGADLGELLSLVSLLTFAAMPDRQGLGQG